MGTAPGGWSGAGKGRDHLVHTYFLSQFHGPSQVLGHQGRATLPLTLRPDKSRKVEFLPPHPTGGEGTPHYGVGGG